MNIRRAVGPIVMALAVSVAAAPLAALEQKPFDAAAFKDAQAAGAPVIVHVTAPWCPTCTSQHARIDALAAKPEFASVTLFKIDFDSQEEQWKSLGARTQSTLIGYAGTRETGRLVGETKAEPIEKLISSTLAK